MKRIPRLTILLSIGWAFFIAPPIHAQEAMSSDVIENRLAKQLYLSDLLKYAILTNPQITVGKESWKISIEEYRIKKSYPDPQVMTTYYPSPIETRLGPQEWNLTISQTIPFPGKLDQQGQILETETEISRLKLDRTIKTITASITASFYELGYIQTAIRIAKRNYNLAAELLKIGTNAWDDNKALFYDVSKAQAQLAQIKYDILLLEELALSEKANLNGLLNRPPNADLGDIQEPALREVIHDISAIHDLSLKHQEDILIAQKKVEKSEEAIHLSRFKNRPSFKLGLFYASIGDPDVASPPPDAGKDAVGIQFGLSIPIWTGKNNSQTQKALAQRQKAKAEKQAIANQTKARISRLYFKLQNSKRLISLYKNELIPKSIVSVQTAETWFRQGDGSFSDFLEIQATAYNFQLSLARAKADYGKTLAGLEQMTGTLLDREVAKTKKEVRS